MIQGRPLLATSHARIKVFERQISLGVGEERITFDMNGTLSPPPKTTEEVCIVEASQEEESFDLLGIAEDLFSYAHLYV